MTRIENAKDDYGKPDALKKALARSTAISNDGVMLDRAMAILHRMATEHSGWKRFIFRWYYSDEPLRNDAANLVREAQFYMMIPSDARMLGNDRFEER